MKRTSMVMIALSSVACALAACGDSDFVEDNGEDLGQSERGGIGATEQALLSAAVTIDPRRSLVITDTAIVNSFSLQAVLDQLAAQSGIAGLTGTQLFKQLWDTQNPKPGLTNGPHCDDSPTFNGFSYGCRPLEGAQAQNPSTEIAKYRAVGILNRFDLAPSGGADCGEYRIVFARTPESITRRNLISFDAVLANPHPGFGGLEGCRAVANFWAKLSSNSDVTSRKNALLDFYFNGLDGFMPVLHFENLGTLGNGRTTTGRVRTNQFLQAPRTFREFKLQKTCGSTCNMFFVPSTDKTNPHGTLFADNSGQPLGADFQTKFLAQVEKLAINDLNAFNHTVEDQFNTGESNAQTTPDTYTSQFNANGTFAANIQTKLTSLGSTLTPTDIVARAEALSCAGCHQISRLKPIGGGLTFPSSLGFMHVSDTQQEPGPDGFRFNISLALKEVFMPQRKLVLETFINSTPIHSGVATDRCLDAGAYYYAQSWECNGTAAQRWFYTAAGELRSGLDPNRCLDLYNQGTANGTSILANTCNGSSSQRWTRTAAGELRSVLAPAMCMDVAGASANNGTQVQLYACNGTKGQRWFEQPNFPVENPVAVPIEIHDVRLNGLTGTSSNTYVGATPGQTIPIDVDYTISQMTTCPSCIDQIMIGIGSAAQGCVYNGIPSMTGTSGTGSMTLTAPSTPGVYYVRFRNGQSYHCDLNWWGGADMPTDAQNIAVITVN